MKRLFQSFFCLLAALHLLAGPLGVLQLVAWSQMIKDYSQEKGLVAGVMATFDGKHPCKMCQKISASEQQEEKKPVLPESKIDLVSKWLGMLPTMELPTLNWRDAVMVVRFAAPVSSHSQWGSTPPVPPPRLTA
ncbi:hypothetical protein BH11VER1_BH11VER1_02730 [soil metagenome]